MRGVGIDNQGRCQHYFGPNDVVGNKCATCEQWWACHRCHEELADHPFGRMLIDDPTAIRCGCCERLMPYGHQHCPQCGQPFNPGCSVHTHVYFVI